MSLFTSTKKQLKRLIVGIFGGFLLLIGIIAIPYPGPGWLIVFAALAILATEFDWAKRLLHYARRKYHDWQAWIKSKGLSLQILFWLITLAVVTATLYLLNVYGILNNLFELDIDWLQSPLPWY